MSELVRAGGGVVWRLVPDGAEVVLVHRPAYDDWTFPKGKAGPEEADEQAALREVREETGFACRLGAELPSTTYVDLKDRPKTVRYWAMTVVLGPPGGPAGPAPPAEGGEVDIVRWQPVASARRMLTYARDVVVLDGFQQLVLDELRSNVRRKKVDDVAEAEPQRE